MICGSENEDEHHYHRDPAVTPHCAQLAKIVKEILGFPVFSNMAEKATKQARTAVNRTNPEINKGFLPARSTMKMEHVAPNTSKIWKTTDINRVLLVE